MDAKTPKGFTFTERAMEVVRGLASGDGTVAYVSRVGRPDPGTGEVTSEWGVVGVSNDWAPADRVVEIDGVRVLFTHIRTEELVGRQMDWCDKSGWRMI